MPDGLYLSAIEYPAEFGFDELDGGITLLSPFTGALG
ncbi:tRNA pseudouridine synthase A [Bordetella pertussis]|nr:tRNA pseudouridine synthase A [Bordetella pertussis]CPM07832.1 tRNA pseudouridine synthase A [Bordetella pertussis]CPO78684.1 tRNA pseudouridine synthase A [Bordetella pertussis]